MNRNASLTVARWIRNLCLLLVPLMATSTFAFAATSDQNAVITPRLAFAVNSSELLLFNKTPETSPKLLKNGAPAISIDGATYVPIRAFCDALGYGLKSNTAQKSLTIGNNDKTVELFLIQELADLSNEASYFVLNDVGYTKVLNFAKPDALQIKWQEDVLLLYSLAASSGGVETVEPPKPPVEVKQEGTLAPAKKTTNYPDSTQNPDETIWSEVYTRQGNQIVLTSQLLQGLKKNAVAPQKNYSTAIKSAYDAQYYKPFVNPYVPYSYPQMLKDIKKLELQYPEYISTSSAGKSVEGRDLITIEFGKGSKHIYLLGTHHAREYISTTYIMYFVNQTAFSAKTGINSTKFDTNNILNKVTYHIIPMVNPDGVNLVQNGIESVSPKFREKVRAMPIVGTQYGYQGWKSNINGVDLNRNYPVNWGSYSTKHKNASSFYPGPKAASEPEVQGVMKYLSLYTASANVSVHTQGELIYWANPTGKMSDMERKMIASSGFTPIRNTLDNSPAGFLANYVIDGSHAHQFTIELCKNIGPYPYPDAKFDEVWAPAKELLLIVGNEVAKK